MPTDAQMAQRRKELLATEMAARREQAEATLTNLMTGETVPMPGLLPDPVETIRPQTAESLNRANLNTMLRAADRNRLFGVNRTDVPPSLIQGEEWQQQVLADQTRDAEAPGTDVDAMQAQPGLIPRTVPVYPGAKDAMVEKPSGIARALNLSMDNRQRTFNRNQQDWERTGGVGSLGGSGAVTRAPTTDARTTAKAELSNDVSILNQIKRKKNILRAVSSIWGTKDNSSSYEASAVAKYKDIVNQRALQSILKKGVPDTNAELSVAWLNAGGGVDYLPTVLNMGLIPNKEGYVTLYNHEDTKAKPWTGRIDSPEFVKRIKSRDWHQDKPVKDPVGRSMRFVDPEGVGHLGYVKTDENGLPRYFLRDDTKVPEGWDMVDPAASKTEITNNLGKQGQKMGEARQVAMAAMSRKWSNDAASYFFDESGNFKADRLDIILTSLNVPGEGRLAWAQMRTALANALRLESGAAISVAEAAEYKSKFFPTMTDTEKTIIWKLRAFSDYIRMLEETNNPQWVYDNLPYTIWNPAEVRTEKQRDALPPGSYFTIKNKEGLHKLPHPSDSEVQL